VRLTNEATALTGRAHYLDSVRRYHPATQVNVADEGDSRWSIRRMLFVSAVLSVGLWAPTIYLAVKAFGH